MTAHEEYFNYLKNRSLLGFIYRKYWLYPRLCTYFSGKVLDVGCGLGDFLKYRPNTIGVDVNPNTVAWCKSQSLSVLLLDEGRLPFEEDTFDGAVLDNVLEHIVEPSQLLNEIKRVVKPDGVLLVGVPGKKGYASDQDHKVFYNQNELIDRLSEAGFRKSTIFYMPFKFDWLDRHMSQYCIYGVFRN